MRFLNRVIAVLAVLMLDVGRAESDEKSVQFRIAEAYPGLLRQLAEHDTLYVRILYRSDRRVRFIVEAHAGGEQVSAGSHISASPLNPAGEGEAIMWISFARPILVDALRISAFDPSWTRIGRINVEARVEWGGSEARAMNARLPGWVQRLSAKQEILLDAERRSELLKVDQEIVLSVGDLWIAGACLLAYLILQPVLAIWMIGTWRLMSMLPLLEMVPLAAQAAVAYERGAASWNVGLAYGAVISFVYLIVLAGIYWGRKHRDGYPG